MLGPWHIPCVHALQCHYPIVCMSGISVCTPALLQSFMYPVCICATGGNMSSGRENFCCRATPASHHEHWLWGSERRQCCRLHNFYCRYAMTLCVNWQSANCARANVKSMPPRSRQNLSMLRLQESGSCQNPGTLRMLEGGCLFYHATILCGFRRWECPSAFCYIQPWLSRECFLVEQIVTWHEVLRCLLAC